MDIPTIFYTILHLLTFHFQLRHYLKKIYDYTYPHRSLLTFSIFKFNPVFTTNDFTGIHTILYHTAVTFHFQVQPCFQRIRIYRHTYHTLPHTAVTYVFKFDPVFIKLVSKHIVFIFKILPLFYLLLPIFKRNTM